MGLQDRDYYKEHHKELKKKLNKKSEPEQKISWILLFKALMTLGGIFVILDMIRKISNIA